jgi:rubredoxin
VRGDDAARLEGSGLGDRKRLDPRVKLECKVCWYVYDPQVGDDHWQVPPGTAFADLPAHWTCPNCSAEREHFMVVCDG